jgi:hypothetical protein
MGPYSAGLVILSPAPSAAETRAIAIPGSASSRAYTIVLPHTPPASDNPSLSTPSLEEVAPTPSLPLKLKFMTLEELEREYVSLRQQADAVRSYL